MKHLNRIDITLALTTKASCAEFSTASTQINEYIDYQNSWCVRLAQKTNAYHSPDEQGQPRYLISELTHDELLDVARYVLPRSRAVLDVIENLRNLIRFHSIDSISALQHHASLSQLQEEIYNLHRQLIAQMLSHLEHISSQLDFNTLQTTQSDIFTGYQHLINTYGSYEQKQRLQQLAWYCLNKPHTVTMSLPDRVIQVPAQLATAIPSKPRWPAVFFPGHNLRYHWFLSRQSLLARLKLAFAKPITIDLKNIQENADWLARWTLHDDLRLEIAETEASIKNTTWYQQETRQFLNDWQQALKTYQQQIYREQIEYVSRTIHQFESLLDTFTPHQRHILRVSCNTLLDKLNSIQIDEAEISLYKKTIQLKLAHIDERLANPLTTGVSTADRLAHLSERRIQQLQQLAEGKPLTHQPADVHTPPISNERMRARWCLELTLFIKSIVETHDEPTCQRVAVEIKQIAKQYQHYWTHEKSTQQEIADHQESILAVWYEKTGDKAGLDFITSCRQLRQSEKFDALRALCQSHAIEEKPALVKAPESLPTFSSVGNDSSMSLKRAEESTTPELLRPLIIPKRTNSFLNSEATDSKRALDAATSTSKKSWSMFKAWEDYRWQNVFNRKEIYNRPLDASTHLEASPSTCYHGASASI